MEPTLQHILYSLYRPFPIPLCYLNLSCSLLFLCRPYGSAAFIATYDANGPQLYLVEPSGVAHRYFGTAVGKGRQSVKTEIERLKFDQMTCRQAVVEAAKV